MTKPPLESVSQDKGIVGKDEHSHLFSADRQASLDKQFHARRFIKFAKSTYILITIILLGTYPVFMNDMVRLFRGGPAIMYYVTPLWTLLVVMTAAVSLMFAAYCLYALISRQVVGRARVFAIVSMILMVGFLGAVGWLVPVLFSSTEFF